MKKHFLDSNWLIPLLMLALFVLSWELTCTLFQHLIFVLPRPSQVVQVLIESPNRFILHSLVTSKEMLGGIAIAFSAAFPLAWLMLKYQLARRTFQPLFIVIQCMPMFTLAPIMVICFGWSYTAIVIPTALMIFFPLTLSIYKGLCSTPQAYLDLFKVNQATEWQTFFKLRLPGALSHIFAGLRISGGIAGIGAVAGEWAGGQSGLGMLMQESRHSTDLETCFAAFFCLTGISLILYASITSFESFLLNQRRQNFSSKNHLSALLIAFCITLSGCQGETQAPKETRILLDWFPNPNHVALYAGVENGIFEKHGLFLNIQKLHDPSQSIPYISSGQTELAIYYMPYTIRSYSQGANIQVLGVLVKEPLDGLLVRCDAEINTLEDLNGKTIGYSLGGLNSAYIRSLMKKRNIKPDKCRNVHFDIISSIGTKSVDATFGACWNIEMEHLKSLGVDTKFFMLRDFDVPNYYELVILASKYFINQNPDKAINFQKALQESIDFSKEHPEKAFDLYAKANPDKSLKTLIWEKKAWTHTYPLLAKNQDIDHDCWTNFCSWMYEQHLIDDIIETKGLFPCLTKPPAT